MEHAKADDVRSLCRRVPRYRRPAAGHGRDACPGSGAMMLMGGVDAAVGNSALVGLPSGIDGGSAATGPGVTAGMFHDGA